MHLRDLWAVTGAVRARDDLIAQRDRAKVDLKLYTGYSSFTQDDEMVDVIRPALMAELQRRIDQVEQQLKDLGVDLTPADG